MNLRNFYYFISEAIINIKRNSLLTITAISTVAISLTIFGGFLFVLVNLQGLANSISAHFEVVAYLKPNLDDTRIALLKTNLLYLEGVDDVKFISKETALQKMEKDLKGNIKLSDVIADNPLPDSFEIKVRDPNLIRKVAKGIKEFEGIDKVKYGQEVLSRILKLSDGIRMIGLYIAILLGIGTIFLITNTVRLTIFSRREEIRIMQLVGATDWFIRWPYILEGIIHGIIGAFISCCILIGAYLYFIPKIQKDLPFIPIVQDVIPMVNICLILFNIGIFLGMVGSLIAVGKYLQEA